MSLFLFSFFKLFIYTLFLLYNFFVFRLSLFCFHHFCLLPVFCLHLTVCAFAVPASMVMWILENILKFPIIMEKCLGNLCHSCRRIGHQIMHQVSFIMFLIYIYIYFKYICLYIHTTLKWLADCSLNFYRNNYSNSNSYYVMQKYNLIIT